METINHRDLRGQFAHFSPGKRNAMAKREAERLDAAAKKAKKKKPEAPEEEPEG